MDEFGDVRVNCGEGNSAIIIDNSKDYEELLGKVKVQFNTSERENAEVLNKDTEYFYARCVKFDSDVILKNIKNDQVANEFFKNSIKIAEKYQTQKVRPFSVILFIIDSASRNFIYRNLCTTVELLNEMISDDNRTFKFMTFY